MKKVFYFFFLLILASCSRSGVYYIDAENGDDSNSGYSPKSAWKSLRKVNNAMFLAGDKIYFKSGCQWNGQLEVKGSGSSDAPILINKYGEGNKPVINGQGEKLHSVLLFNVEYWEVRNLEITNTGNDKKERRRGVIVSADNFGECHHIVLDSLEIHHVNGSLVKSNGGGSAIFWENKGDSIKTRFVDLQITNCHLHHCGRNGINSRGYTNRKNWFPSLGVVIRNNVLEQIPGDGIVPIGCDGALIEHNSMRHCPDILAHTEAAAGIWPWCCDNTIIQFNEVSGHKAKWDGQGFDSDWGCNNTIIQYNYSHDNYGGFLLICNNGEVFGKSGNGFNRNTIIRYNVSINDGIRPYRTKRRGWFSPTLHISGPVENSKIYNNIFIVPKKENKDIARSLVEMDNWGGPWPIDTWFANNVFFVEGASSFTFKEDINTTFSNNNYWGKIAKMPNDASAIFENPMFINDKARGDGFKVLKNFMLQKYSPCMGKGIFVNNNGEKDLFGNTISRDPNIGVYESN